jgi:hypothetical protein
VHPEEIFAGVAGEVRRLGVDFGEMAFGGKAEDGIRRIGDELAAVGGALGHGEARKQRGR